MSTMETNDCRGTRQTIAKYIPGPSVKRIADALHVDLDAAKRIKGMMRGELNSKRIADEMSIPDRQYKDRVLRILSIASALSDSFGVEYLHDKRDSFSSAFGIEYVNAGDTYKDTLMYDNYSGRFICGSWGDVVERNERRFS